ncbi:uncharacterized protein K02A2.6-like [Haliotis rufescens]|uniref:uncharacterized protein K02A2.6-like n=1 Tax=Haliotis rufescens TaxID=6454 RepID=UPI00201F2A61|nr:uncharacterized protein K02A2.6-like [Haliotis rufescens]XP_046348752.2 uncharacterized protein K02A2.6-like [Haliotis rufescens]XP_048250284.1 uncharacterized protein K02A2.6-like [Haliotis rufescens]
MVNDLLLKGNRLVIPLTLRSQMLEKIHAGHQGIRKCRERAMTAVWWPGLSAEIRSVVEHCKICSKYRRNPTEPLLPTPIPDRPWQRVGTDLFELNKAMYILVIDYFSRYIEVIKLSSTTSKSIINSLKSVFSRHGIPEVVISDNGPQYSSQDFCEFAHQYNFTHITSSPLYPRSNGEAERAVQSCKNMLRKADDPYLAMLEYRSTPVSGGLSPSELLMGRKLRTSLPCHPTQLQSKHVDVKRFKQTESVKKLIMKDQYDHHHNVRPMSELKPGDCVWVNQSESKVVGKADTPRSYIVSTPKGEVRRNRCDLKLIPGTKT